VERHRARAPLITGRLRGEPVVPAHAAVLTDLLGDPRVGAWLGGTATAADVRAEVAAEAQHWARHGFGLWTFFDRAGGALAGRGGLIRAEVEGEPVVELAWAVTPERWREGLATEIGRASADVAFGALGLDALVAFTLPHNAASRRVMEKLGMRCAGPTTHAGLPHVLYRLAR
jgi:RimJ/RimL family protein N-acetyltransferase